MAVNCASEAVRREPDRQSFVRLEVSLGFARRLSLRARFTVVLEQACCEHLNNFMQYPYPSTADVARYYYTSHYCPPNQPNQQYYCLPYYYPQHAHAQQQTMTVPQNTEYDAGPLGPMISEDIKGVNGTSQGPAAAPKTPVEGAAPQVLPTPAAPLPAAPAVSVPSAAPLVAPTPQTILQFLMKSSPAPTPAPTPTPTPIPGPAGPPSGAVGPSGATAGGPRPPPQTFAEAIAFGEAKTLGPKGARGALPLSKVFQPSQASGVMSTPLQPPQAFSYQAQPPQALSYQAQTSSTSPQPAVSARFITTLGQAFEHNCSACLGRVKTRHFTAECKYKSEDCEYYDTPKGCQKGNACNFVHAPEEPVLICRAIETDARGISKVVGCHGTGHLYDPDKSCPGVLHILKTWQL